jgi:signal transduction histidine kinase
LNTFYNNIKLGVLGMKIINKAKRLFKEPLTTWTEYRFNIFYRKFSDKIKEPEKTENRAWLARMEERKPLKFARAKGKFEDARQLTELRDEKNEIVALLGTAAHDLRSPFNGLLGFLQITSEGYHGLGADELQSYLQNAYESAKKIHHAQDKILQLVCYYIGNLDLPAKKIGVSNVADKVVEEHKAIAQKKGVLLTNSVGKDACIYGNEVLLERILANLVSNALKFTKEGGVTISAAPAQGGKVEIIVSDTGIGMPEEILKELFKPGGKVRCKGVENEESNGIGLIMIASMARKSGGRIWAESEKGKGSRFHVELPSAQASP